PRGRLPGRAAPPRDPGGALPLSPVRVPTFVVLGGAAIGAGSVRQLLRAIAAGRLESDRIVVVDRDPACAASRMGEPRVRLVTADWSDWLDRHLSLLGAKDQIVPYHWAPHVLVEWLGRQIERAGGAATRGGGVPPHGVPVERPTAGGDRALSYATWICPPTCVEPALCPHTRGPSSTRSWLRSGPRWAGSTPTCAR